MNLPPRAEAWGAIVNPQASQIDVEAHLLLGGSAAHVLPALLAGL